MNITAEQFLLKNKKEDLCFLVSDGKLSDEFEDYFEENKECVTDYQSLQDILENAKHINVYKKVRPKIAGTYIAETIESYLEGRYGYDSYEFGSLTDLCGVEIFDKLASELNKNINYYTSGDLVYCLNLSRKFKAYLKDELGEDYPKEY